MKCVTLRSWNALISDCLRHGRPLDALRTYMLMLHAGIDPNPRTFISLFKACADISDLPRGTELHRDAQNRGFTSNLFVINTVISMYGKCGAIVEAEDAFCAMADRSVVSWNVMLSAYAEQGCVEKILRLFRQMQEEGKVSPDEYTLVLVVRACGALQPNHNEDNNSVSRNRNNLAGPKVNNSISSNSKFLVSDNSVYSRPHKIGYLEIGQAIHSYANRRKLTCGGFLLNNSLVSMYGKCGDILQAENVLYMLPRRDVVSWSAILSIYVEYGEGEKALISYVQMQNEGVDPDKVSCILALQACACLAEKELICFVEEGEIKRKSLEIGQALKSDLTKKGYISDKRVATALIGMYGKCGVIYEAECVFDEVIHRDLVSWNAMLSAYVEQSEGEKVLLLYRQMHKMNVGMDDVTIICSLQACNEIGSLEVCKELHFVMISCGSEKFLSLVATLIHTYGSCGSMLEANTLHDALTEPDIVSWTAFIASHRSKGEDLSIFEESKIEGILPDEIMFMSLLTTFSHMGLVTKALGCFESMISDYGITPKIKHYGIVIDLLGRAGDFKRIVNLLRNMPFQPDLAILWFLLGACTTHGNVELAKQAFDLAVTLEPKQANAYIFMSIFGSNIFQSAIQKSP